jgi:hypothetical protein
MKNILLASVGALALCAVLPGAASADISGTLSGSYADDTNGGGDNIWNVSGSLTDTFAGNWGAEVAGGYHNLDSSSADIWNVGGSLFWASMQGRLAATVNYDDISVTGGDVHFTSYGVGGEWYAGPSFTVGVKGGGTTVDISGFSGNTSGGYAGGMLKGYLMPNLALSGSVDYVGISGGHLTSETARVEWLFSQSTPVSIYGGYQHVDSGSGGFLGSSNDDIFFVGLKLYMNGSGGGTLVDRQRNGSLGYIAQPTLFWDQY